MLAVEVAGEVLAAIASVCVVALTGLGAWTLTKLVRLSEAVATLTATTKTLEATTSELFKQVHEMQARELERVSATARM